MCANSLDNVCSPIPHVIHITCEAAIQRVAAIVIKKVFNGPLSGPCSIAACVSKGDQYLLVLWGRRTQRGDVAIRLEAGTTREATTIYILCIEKNLQSRLPLGQMTLWLLWHARLR